MRITRWMVAAMLGWGCFSATPLRAQAQQQPGAQQPGAQAVDPALAPFISSSTLLVAKLDPGQIDPAAAVEWWRKLAGATAEDADVASASKLGAQWKADYTQAGGSVAYAVVFLGMPQDLPAVVIVPMATDANPTSLESLLVNGVVGGNATRSLGGDDPENSVEAIVLNNAIVFGKTSQVEKMRLLRPADRPIFAQALASAGDMPVKLAFVPSFALTVLAGQALPETLPPEYGGGDTSTLVHGLSYLALGLTTPGAESALLHVECKTPAAQQAYANLIHASLATLANDPAMHKNIPAIDQMIAAIQPVAQDKALTLSLDTPTIERDFVPTLSQAMQTARKQAINVQEMSQLRQLSIAMINYDMDHKGQFPDSLDSLATYVGGSINLRKLITSVHLPQADPGVIYVKPPVTLEKAGEANKTVMLYEAYAADSTQVIAAYLDGHAEIMPKADFEALAKAQGFTAAPVGK